jgi:hypothetical protein
VYRKAHELGLKKPPEFVAAEAARQMNRFDHPAREHRFQKGHASWNKGTKGVAGVQEAAARPSSSPASAAQHPADRQHEVRQGRDAAAEVSNAKGNNSARWRGVHELVWVEANGPVPPKHIVVFKPGMRTNVLEEITSTGSSASAWPRT